MKSASQPHSSRKDDTSASHCVKCRSQVAEPLNASGSTVNHQCKWDTNTGKVGYDNAVSRSAADCYV